MKPFLTSCVILFFGTTGFSNSPLLDELISPDTLQPGADRHGIGVQLLGPEGVYGITYTALRFSAPSRYEKIYVALGETEEWCFFCVNNEIWKHHALSFGKLKGWQKGVITLEAGLLAQLWFGQPVKVDKVEKLGVGFGPIINLSFSPRNIQYFEFYFGLHLVGNTFMLGNNPPLIAPFQIGLRWVSRSKKARQLTK